MERFASARRKLTLALLALCGALALLGTATYAWYTLSTAPEVSGIEFGVSAAQALLVSNKLDGKYEKQLDLNKMSDTLPLVPASTLDGLNWFVCRYEPNGDVREEKSKTAGSHYFNNQFEYLRFPHGGNGEKSPSTPTDPGNGTATPSTFWEEINDKSLYAWQDIYLKTTEESVQVHIANGVQKLTGEEKQDENYRYGTYVLGYRLVEGKDEAGNKTVTVRLNEGGPETCARVGLLVLEEYDENNQATNKYDNKPFYILEPNADTRSAADKTDNAYNADVYVPNFNVKEQLGSLIPGEGNAWQKANGYYLPTYPVTLRSDLNDQLDLINGKTSAKRVDEYVAAGTIGKDDDVTAETAVRLPTDTEIYTTLAADGTPGLNQKNLIVMTTSTWAALQQQTTPGTEESGGENGEGGNTPSAQTEGNEGGGGESEPASPARPTVSSDKLVYDSRVVGTFGQFVSTDSLYNENHKTQTDARQFWAENIEDKTTTTASKPLFTLTKNKPVKVRLYFWVEGQDIDCWNDVSGSNFLVNLELSGDVKKNA